MQADCSYSVSSLSADHAMGGGEKQLQRTALIRLAVCRGHPSYESIAVHTWWRYSVPVRWCVGAHREQQDIQANCKQASQERVKKEIEEEYLAWKRRENMLLEWLQR